MANGTDRGIAVVTRDAEGRQTVYVCSAVNGGQPSDVFAMHVAPPALVVDPDVAMLRTGTMAHTRTMVLVSTDQAGTVRIQLPPKGAGLTV
jgi:hypothetical protein